MTPSILASVLSLASAMRRFVPNSTIFVAHPGDTDSGKLDAGAIWRARHSTLRGALVEAPDVSLTLGIIVDDLDAALVAAVSSGGAVAMPTMENGRVRKAQVTDPAGSAITLIQR